jgi:hypothetical protein
MSWISLNLVKKFLLFTLVNFPPTQANFLIVMTTIKVIQILKIVPVLFN